MQKSMAFGPCCSNFWTYSGQKDWKWWFPTFISKLENQSVKVFQTWCMHLMLVFSNVWLLGHIGPISPLLLPKTAENIGFQPLSRKFITQSIPILAYTRVGCVLRIDSLLGHIGPNCGPPSGKKMTENGGFHTLSRKTLITQSVSNFMHT